MNILVAVTSNWGIGCKNKLLFDIREDLQRFKEMTTGKVVVMGHNTLKSLPNGVALPNRVNIVLSRKTALTVPNAIVCNSTEQLFKTLETYPPEDVFVIGGQDIYFQLLNNCTHAYVTKIEATVDADTFFPNLDERNNWEICEESDTRESNGVYYRFCTYKQRL